MSVEGDDEADDEDGNDDRDDYDDNDDSVDSDDDNEGESNKEKNLKSHLLTPVANTVSNYDVASQKASPSSTSSSHNVGGQVAKGITKCFGLNIGAYLQSLRLIAEKSRCRGRRHSIMLKKENTLHDGDAC
ncbi:uncharacterized protein [Rutidosis leptorrhynchoides]|uniref:uncharacterized protein isoform X2 n=1 Tax=Rutidosis leptorrhynchoides TaxID=125765 RepID=UPI003A992748